MAKPLVKWHGWWHEITSFCQTGEWENELPYWWTIDGGSPKRYLKTLGDVTIIHEEPNLVIAVSQYGICFLARRSNWPARSS